MPMNKSERVFKDLLVQSPSWVEKYGACWHELDQNLGRLLTGDYPSIENPNCQGEWMIGDYWECKCTGEIGFHSISKQMESEGDLEFHKQHNPDLTDGQHLEAMLESVTDIKGFVTWLHKKKLMVYAHTGGAFLCVSLLKAKNLLDALYEFNEGR